MKKSDTFAFEYMVFDMKKEEKKKTLSKKAKKFLIWFWGIFGGSIFLVFLLFALIAKGAIGYMPALEELENPIDKYASQVISADMKFLGTYSKEKENRIYVNYNDLSPALVHALIATEDERFSKHSGIDFYALVRAAVKTIIMGQKNAGGGSTITQQLAKQLYSPRAGSYSDRIMQKPIEWVIAVKLERYYTKEEIINLYLNKFDFNYNAVGIQSAAQVYFGKKPAELTVDESATLAGMCKNSVLYNPIRRNQLTKDRRNVVLSLMERNGYLSNTERDTLQQLPLEINFHKADHKEGIAPYFREYLRLTMSAKKPDRRNYAAWQTEIYKRDSAAWVTDPLYGWCNKNRKSNNGSNYNLATDGLKIYATIDSRMQQYAEEAMHEHLGMYLQELFFKEKKGRNYAPFSKNLSADKREELLLRTMKLSDRYRGLKQNGLSEEEIRKIFDQPVEMVVFSWKGLKDTIMSPMDSIKYMKSFLRSGLMAMDVNSGDVKAYVGGIDFSYFQYDMVNVGRRQVGSTIKPFLYSLAVEEGISPCYEVLHVQPEYTDENGRPWLPRNANKSRMGEMVSVKWGLQNSDNWVTAALMMQLSPRTFVDMLHSYGITGQIDAVLSLCLGTCDVSIAEMVQGYSAFANRGFTTTPIYVSRIEDNFGNVLDSFSPIPSEVLSENTSYKMLDMLRSVVDGGTGSRLRYKYEVRAPIGGKTGTTQNNSDGWFMGFTPSLVAGVWVGGEDRDIHFDGMEHGQAAAMALPVFALFMQKIYADKSLGYSSTENFEIPGTYRGLCSDGRMNVVMMPTMGEEIWE